MVDDASHRHAGPDAGAAAGAASGGASGPRLLDQSILLDLVGYAATRASIPLKKAFARHMGPLDLKAVELSILVVVAANRDVNQKQLSQTLEVSAPNLAVMLDRLEARGLVRRVRGTADRRETFIHLTAAGRDLHRRAMQVAATMERDVTRVLTEAERRLLIELLHRVARGRAPRRG